MPARRIALFATLGLLTLGLIAALALPAEEEPPAPPPAEPVAEAPPPTDAFGLPKTEDYTVHERRVRRDEAFSDLLEGYDVPYQQVVALAKGARDVFDIRRIRAGNTCRIYIDEAAGRAAYMVYQIDAERYVAFDIDAPEATRMGTRPVQVDWKTAGGTITRSLYETLDEAGAHPELALSLSEVFAWQIDFFRIRRGDRFRVLYEARTLDGESLAPGRVIAARFTHRGTDYYAFRFNGGARTDYFDEDGNSVRRALLKSPLRFRRISSRFSRSRLHPVTGRRRAHLGTDYAAPTGTPVRSVGDGTVQVAGYGRANGNWVKIRHNATYTTGYLHLSRIASGVRRGARITQGQIIGYVGSTGLATGPHLHYHFWKHGEPVNALNVELPPVQPVYPQYRAEYERLVATLKPQLDRPAPLSPVFAARPPEPTQLAGQLAPLSMF